MKFCTEDMNEIHWLRNPGETQFADTISRIIDSGRLDELFERFQDENGCVDCDALYDYLRHEGGSALLDVGLHENESEHSVEDVLKAWEEENAPCRVWRDGDGNPRADIYKCSSDTYLDFDYIDEDGSTESESLDEKSVFDLVGDNNSTVGKWDCDNVESAEFECWRDER